MVALKIFQSVARKGQQILTRTQVTGTKLTSLNRKFVHPFTFESAGPSNPYNRITTQSTPSTRPSTPQTNSTSDNVNSKAYATVASHHTTSAFSPADKFRVPFDEGPSMGTLDNIVEQVEALPGDVAKERGYHIVGKVKAKQDDMLKILAVGDMRIWQ